MKEFIFEVCCGSVDDVIQAEKGGADRVELNSNLFYGGLTPSIGSLIAAKKLTGVKIMTMVRPREGGFKYTDAEFQTALIDAKELLAHGADGIVFGFLKSDGSIDTKRCKKMMDIIGDKASVFHRAIDVVPDWRKAIDTLADLGVTRILTSGQEPNVFFGLDTVREMIEYAGGRIEILPGAGVTEKNMLQIIHATGCTQLHFERHKLQFDTSTSNNNNIFYGGALYPPEDRYGIIDTDYIADVCKKIR